MSTIWGPAYDAEIAYRRETLTAAATARRGGRGRGRRSRRGAGGTTARTATPTHLRAAPMRPVPGPGLAAAHR